MHPCGFFKKYRATGDRFSSACEIQRTRLPRSPRAWAAWRAHLDIDHWISGLPKAGTTGLPQWIDSTKFRDDNDHIGGTPIGPIPL